MIRTFRSRFGRSSVRLSSLRFFPSVHSVLALIFLVAGLAGCAPKETVDPWKLSPPTLETTNSSGIRLRFAGNRSTVTKFSTDTVFDESSSIRFEPADHGLDLKATSECSAAAQNGSARIEHKTLTRTSAAVSFLALLPPATLSPPALKKTWICNFKISVTNPHGSRSEGAFQNLKIQNVRALERSLVASAKSESASILLRRRLACPQWWSEAKIATNEAIAENAAATLHQIANATQVQGTDSRTWERRPVCSILDTVLSGDKEMTILNGTFQPTYRAPRLSWTRAFLLPSGKYENLMNRPVVQWTIRNEESLPQTVFIPSAASDLRLATRLHFNEVLSWTKPLRAQVVFTESGGVESRTTSQGFYVRIAAGGSVNVVLHSGRGPYIMAMAEFGLPKGATHLMLSTKKPMILESLANESDVPSLAKISDAELDAQPKDIHREEDAALIDTVVLAASPAQSTLVETGLTITEALAMGPSIDDAIVINLTPNENYSEITD